MAIEGIEEIMDDIDARFKADIPTYITEINAEKSDFNLDTFVEESYALWSIPDIQPYPISFLQYLSKDPKIVNTVRGAGFALQYEISIVCFIQEDGTSNISRKQARYNRILQTIVKKNLARRWAGILVVDSISIPIQNQAGQTYTLASIGFVMDIC